MEEEKRYCVYKHVSPSGKVYIGLTCQPVHKRWKNGYGYADNPYFYKAIQKYGWDNFDHEVLYEQLTSQEAADKEIELIALYQSNRSEFGYNISGGGFNRVVSDTTREKIRQALLGRKRGPMSEEQKRKISDANRGRKHSEESKQKLSEIRTEQWKDEEFRNKLTNGIKRYYQEHPGLPGRKQTEETKQKLREKNLGDKNPNYGIEHTQEWCMYMSTLHSGANNPVAKLVVQCDLNNKPIKVWEYIKQAADVLSIHKTAIIQCCRQKSQTSGGFKWFYVYDQTKKDDTIIQGAISLGYLKEEEIECLKS